MGERDRRALPEALGIRGADRRQSDGREHARDGRGSTTRARRVGDRLVADGGSGGGCGPFRGVVRKHRGPGRLTAIGAYREERGSRQQQEARDRLATKLPGTPWDTGVKQDTLLAAVQDDAKRYALIDRYLPDGRYRDLDAALQLIPEEGGRDLQGGNTPGGEPGAAGAFREGPVGRGEPCRDARRWPPRGGRAAHRPRTTVGMSRRACRCAGLVHCGADNPVVSWRQ